MLILTILKWIGIILLILLAFAILLICYCLFLPFFYSAKGFIDDNRVAFCIHDPLYFFNLIVSYTKTDKLKICVRLIFNLFKIKLNKGDKKPKEEDNSSKKQEKTKPKKEKKAKKFFKVLTDSDNFDTFKFFLNKTFKLLNSFLPQKFTCYIDFSTGSPDTTGYVTGFVAATPVLNGKKKKIYPDFLSDKAYIKGKFKIQGQIRLILLLTYAISLFTNRKIRRILQKLR